MQGLSGFPRVPSRRFAFFAVKAVHSSRSSDDAWPGSAHDATRFILRELPECTAIEYRPSDSDRIGRIDDPPQLREPHTIDGSKFCAVHFADPHATRGRSGFGGFLDGTQEIRVVNQIEGIPIVWGTVGAAVRARVDRRLVSWKGARPIVVRRYYIPFRYVESLPHSLRTHPLVVDTALDQVRGHVPSRHPAALMEAAIKKVQQDRERAELELAEAWCRSESSPLYCDGSITASGVASESPLAVGVIKTHRTLYADGAAFRVLVTLEAGSRSSIFEVRGRSGGTVASWYVRIRPATGRDPLFGLVRVESSVSPDIVERANEISRWLIAEGSPVALPDGRWDKMSYGVRETEEFLRAIS